MYSGRRKVDGKVWKVEVIEVGTRNPGYNPFPGVTTNRFKHRVLLDEVGGPNKKRKTSGMGYEWKEQM